MVIRELLLAHNPLLLCYIIFNGESMKLLLFSVTTALGIVTSGLFTYEYVCDFPEAGPKFYGFPFVQRTDTTWIFSMSGDIYLFGFLLNVAFWSGIIYLLGWAISPIKNPIIARTRTVLGWAVFGIMLLLSIQNLTIIDWRIKLHHDNFKMHYYQHDIECERHFYWIR